MAVLRVAVIGGGPGGLSAALILKREHPRWDVGVFERHPAQRTFGYWVGLRWSALKRLATSAPECAEGIREVSRPLTTQTLRRGDAALGVTSGHGLGVSRSALLTVLSRHAAMAGVTIHTGRAVCLAEVCDADVVVVADGAASRTREALAAQLGVTAQTGDLLYLWRGASIPLDAMTLYLTRTTDGPPAAPVMPYGDAASSPPQGFPLCASCRWPHSTVPNSSSPPRPWAPVEPGRTANLVLLDANPIDDVHHLHTVSAVVRAGRYHSPAALNDIKHTAATSRSVR